MRRLALLSPSAASASSLRVRALRSMMLRWLRIFSLMREVYRADRSRRIVFSDVCEQHGRTRTTTDGHGPRGQAPQAFLMRLGAPRCRIYRLRRLNFGPCASVSGEAAFVSVRVAKSAGANSNCRQLQRKPRASHIALRVGPVGGDDAAAMGFGDLLGDREAQARMGAELFFLRALGIEALEDGVELVGRNAGAVILDRDDDLAAQAPAGQDDRAARRAERQGIGQQIAHDLAEARFQARDIERIRSEEHTSE